MAKNTIKVEYLPTEKLIPYARNAKKHSKQQVGQIAASIKEFGFNNPILIADDGTIIAGHGRCLAAQYLGMDKVPCVRLSHLSDTQRRAYTLIDNQLTLNSEWDTDILSLEIQELSTLDLDLKLLGFEDKELKKLLELDEPKNEKEGVDDKQEFLIVVQCRDERDQQELYEDFLSRGIECKIM